MADTDRLSESTLSIERDNGEFNIPVYTAIPNSGDYDGDLVFAQGVGETGESQKMIITQIANYHNVRVTGYDARLSEQMTDPYEQAVVLAHDTYMRVADSQGIEVHRAIGHSLGGFTLATVLEKEADQVSQVALISPITFAPMDAKPEEGQTLQEATREITGEEALSKTIKLVYQFAVRNSVVQSIAGINDIRGNLRAGKNILREIASAKNPQVILGAFAVLANLNTIPVYDAAIQSGTKVTVFLPVKDPVAPKADVEENTKDTQLHDRIRFHSNFRQRGHSDLSTRNGSRQLEQALYFDKIASGSATL